MSEQAGRKKIAPPLPPPPPGDAAPAQNPRYAGAMVAAVVQALLRPPRTLPAAST